MSTCPFYEGLRITVLGSPGERVAMATESRRMQLAHPIRIGWILTADDIARRHASASAAR